MTGLSSSQRTYLTMVMQTLAIHPKWGYLDPAWIMAIMDIESGYNPTVINATGRADGLMQVIPPTAAAMATLYDIPAGPQSNAMLSILSGIAYLDDAARSIIKFRNAPSLPLWDLAQAYNEGFGAVEAGRLDAAYLAKFQAELPIVEAQMAATAMLTNRQSFATEGVRTVMPLMSGATETNSLYTLDLLRRGLMPLTARSAMPLSERPAEVTDMLSDLVSIVERQYCAYFLDAVPGLREWWMSHKAQVGKTAKILSTLSEP